MLVGWCVWVFGLCFVLACCFLAPGEFLPLISFHLLKIPVVDRPCLVLDRQCREKKTESFGPGPGRIGHDQGRERKSELGRSVVASC